MQTLPLSFSFFSGIKKKEEEKVEMQICASLFLDEDFWADSLLGPSASFPRLPFTCSGYVRDWDEAAAASPLCVNQLTLDSSPSSVSQSEGKPWNDKVSFLTLSL